MKLSVQFSEAYASIFILFLSGAKPRTTANLLRPKVEFLFRKQA